MTANPEQNSGGGGGGRSGRMVTSIASADRDGLMPVAAQVTGVDWSKVGGAGGVGGVVPPPPPSRPFTLTLSVGSAHISPVIPHVPNTMYVEWCEAMAIAHSASLGYTHRWHRDHDYIWFVRRHEFDYLAETRLGDDLVMATWVAQMEKSRSHRHYVIYRPKDETVVVRGLTIWVLVSITTRRPQRIPEEMIERYVASTQ